MPNRLATFGEFEFDAEHCEHRQEFARTKFRRAPALESGTGIRGLRRLGAQPLFASGGELGGGAATCGSEFLECLHIDIYIIILGHIYAIY